MSRAEFVTRFAPSPTGELHLGHVLHIAWLWRIARELDAPVLIRMEDHDRTRCRPEYERAILEDLDWLGFVPEAESRRSLDAHPSPFRQSDHPERYQRAFDRLRAAALLYGCRCTRGALEESDGGDRRHDDRCRKGGHRSRRARQCE